MQHPNPLKLLYNPGKTAEKSSAAVLQRCKNSCSPDVRKPVQTQANAMPPWFQTFFHWKFTDAKTWISTNHEAYQNQNFCQKLTILNILCSTRNKTVVVNIQLIFFGCIFIFAFLCDCTKQNFLVVKSDDSWVKSYQLTLARQLRHANTTLKFILYLVKTMRLPTNVSS